MKSQITKKQYSVLQEAYDMLNKNLFGNQLDDCLITISKHTKARGYFSPARCLADKGQTPVHEIGLCPVAFTDEPQAPLELLATLAHEMCHLWQEDLGACPPRRCYHNAEWSEKMISIGLIPSTTAAPGGKQTGGRMSHYVDVNGPFVQLAKPWLKENALQLVEFLATPPKTKVASSSKVKYSCPTCGLNAWAKEGAELTCGDCKRAMTSNS